MPSTKKTPPAAVNPIVKPDLIELNLERSIDLDPEDWYWATWRNLPPLPRPEPKPFDLQDCLKRLRKVTERWDWDKAKIDDILSREEAHFWFLARVISKREINQKCFYNPSDLSDRLSSQTFDGNILAEDIEDFCARLYGNPQYSSKEMLLLVNLLDVEYLVDFCNKFTHKTSIVHGFRFLVCPYLSQARITELQNFLHPRLDNKNWPAPAPYLEPPAEFFLAAGIGMNDDLLTLIESWDDDRFRGGRFYSIYYQKPQEIIFGLKDPRLVSYHTKRLALNLLPPNYILKTSAYIRAWLAHTEYSDLDLIRDAVLSTGQKKEAKEMLKVFALVKAPEAAPFMLELMLAPKAPQVAKQWLEDNPAHAIAGLIPVAANKGKYREAAIDFLRSMKLKGYGDYIQNCCDRELPEIASKIQTTILDFKEKEYIKFNEDTTPEWLRQAIATVEPLDNKKRWQISIDILPPIVYGDSCLNEEQVNALINALRQSELDRPHPLVIAIKSHLDPLELDSFVWKLFTNWLTDGAISKESWAMKAIGLLGTDSSALKLVPLIKIWPRQTQHARTKLGMECLQAIGVTWEQLEDRLVSHCNLDDRGTRIFDFGSRQFRFFLGEDLSPKIEDANRKLQSNLPKPNSKDDRVKADAAIAEWKIFKKQVTEIIKIQSQRLESALSSDRRWEIGDFETYLVKHPIVSRLIQSIVWGGYSLDGNLVTTFRVTEDRNYANERDEICQIIGFDRIGIVHPAHLSPALLSTWAELMSDYEIVSPFPQLSLSCNLESELEITD